MLRLFKLDKKKPARMYLVISSQCMLLQEMERRNYETEEEKRTLIPELRGISREEYLKKREEQKLAEMKDALEDEERLFAVGPTSYASGGPCSSFTYVC